MEKTNNLDHELENDKKVVTDEKVLKECQKLSKKEKKQQKQLEELKDKYNELEDKYYRVLADMDNTRKQNDKDRQYFLKYRAMGFMENLLPILDGFSRALSIPQDDPKVQNYLKGFNYIYRQLLDVLVAEGLKEVTPKVGDVFDSKTMHAIDTKYTEDMPENRVVEIYASGYLLHDRIVRPVMVIVSTKTKKDEDKGKNEEGKDEASNETTDENTNEKDLLDA
jgi:molecular chaperone GrpE